MDFSANRHQDQGQAPVEVGLGITSPVPTAGNEQPPDLTWNLWELSPELATFANSSPSHLLYSTGGIPYLAGSTYHGLQVNPPYSPPLTQDGNPTGNADNTLPPLDSSPQLMSSELPGAHNQLPSLASPFFGQTTPQQCGDQVDHMNNNSLSSQQQPQAERTTIITSPILPAFRRTGDSPNSRVQDNSNTPRRCRRPLSSAREISPRHQPRGLDSDDMRFLNEIATRHLSSPSILHPKSEASLILLTSSPPPPAAPALSNSARLQPIQQLEADIERQIQERIQERAQDHVPPPLELADFGVVPARGDQRARTRIARHTGHPATPHTPAPGAISVYSPPNQLQQNAIIASPGRRLRSSTPDWLPSVQEPREEENPARDQETLLFADEARDQFTMPPSTRSTATRKRSAAPDASRAQPPKRARTSNTAQRPSRVKKESRASVLNLLNDDRIEESKTASYPEFEDSKHEIIDLVDDEVPQQLLEPKPKPKNQVKLSGFQCVICMDNVTALTVTHCGHLYCSACLHSSLHIANAKKICPMCRQKIDIPPVSGKMTKSAKAFWPLELKLMTAKKMGKRKDDKS